MSQSASNDSTEKAFGTNVRFPSIDKLDHHSREFLQRVYSGDTKRYEDRIIAIGFTDKERVLDAGCGFGQWSVALSKFNKMVHAVELNIERLRISKEMAANRDINNIAFGNCSIDALPFRSNSLDAIFCYSAIYNTDYRITFKEFYRVLKPDGALYVNTNGLGWYVYNIIQSHNPAANFNPRVYALKSILNTARYSITKKHKPGACLVMFPYKTVRCLKESGFRDISIGGDGRISVNPNVKAAPFYPERYLGLPNVFEVLSYK